jgi:dienelactone hydrolase
MRRVIALIPLCVLAFSSSIWAEARKVIDIPTRPGVTQRMVVIEPEKPKAAVVLFAGGHGGLQIDSNGDFRWGEKNFLVRTRQLFSSNGLMVIVVDAPSDRQMPPYLNRFRQTPEHVADIKAVIAWIRQQANIPVWLVGTSRGTQSVAFIATQLPLADGGPDGIVLTSTILTDPKGRPVPAMPLEKIQIPTFVVHHIHDGCDLCSYGDLSILMKRLTNTPRKKLLSIDGGTSKGDPCEAMAYHGFNGKEEEVVTKIAEWITRKDAP